MLVVSIAVVGRRDWRTKRLSSCSSRAKFCVRARARKPRLSHHVSSFEPCDCPTNPASRVLNFSGASSTTAVATLTSSTSAADYSIFCENASRWWTRKYSSAHKPTVSHFSRAADASHFVVKAKAAAAAVVVETLGRNLGQILNAIMRFLKAAIKKEVSCLKTSSKRCGDA